MFTALWTMLLSYIFFHNHSIYLQSTHFRWNIESYAQKVVPLQSHFGGNVFVE